MPDSSQVKRTAKGKARAQAVIDFIERLTVPSGKGQGQPFKLDGWQKRFIRDIYEPYHAALAEVIERAPEHGGPQLVAIHSFTPVFRREQRPWHVGVLAADDRRMADRVLALREK